MVTIAFLLWALFFLFLGFSMCPKLVVFGFIVGAVGGFIDGYRKIKQQKLREEKLRKKMREDDFPPVW